MTKDEIQKIALQKWIDNKNIGCVCLSTGTGKTKLAIDCIKHGQYKNILITSPRTNLKENWKQELKKWRFISYDEFYFTTDNPKNYWKYEGFECKITIENIQTCYKWTKEQIQQFDLIVFDEIHTQVSNKYGRLLYNATALQIHRLGLTATPDIDTKIDAEEDDFFADWSTKAEVYEDLCPIIYEYYDSAEDGLINKRRQLVFQYELSDAYTVITGTKKKSFTVGEKSQYEYLTEQIRKGQKLMAATGSTDWFRDAGDWFWKGMGTFEQKNAARIYLQAIKYRKDFLNNLSSSAEIALKIKEKVLSLNPTNKILIFSELTSQANKLSAYAIHSKNEDDTNKKLLQMFDSGEIRELSSVRSLTLGLNLVGANYILRESYNSSITGTIQINGRSDRLDVDDIATVIWIVPLGTQMEEWYKKATKNSTVDTKVFTNLQLLLNEL